MKEITSLTNETIKLYASLNNKKDREEHHLFIVDGDHLVLEAYKHHCLEAVLFTDYLPQELKDYPNLIKVTDGIMAKISNVVDPKNIIGICKYKEQVLPSGATHLIALDGVQDPGNGGTILRSALAFGYQGLLLSNDSFDIYNTKFIRSTMGAFFALPIIRGDLVKLLLALKTNHKIIVADLVDEAKPLASCKFAEPLVIVVGNEGRGPTRAIRTLADEIVIIPISNNIDSLNVGVAASIIMNYFSNI